MNTNDTGTKLVYLSMIFAIGVISAYDNTLSFIHAEYLHQTEQNPMGIYIINKYGVYGFIKAKMIGTILSVLLMCFLVKNKFRVVIPFIFFFQLWLFYYVTYSGGRSILDFRTNVFKSVIDFYYQYWTS
mgnify:FL=1